MSDEIAIPSVPWVLAVVDALNRAGSWTGRIHIQKHVFVTGVLELALPPFEFELYDYGPYSFELDSTIADLELSGLLNRSYPLAGYGPKYELTPLGWEQPRSLAPNDSAVIERVAKRLGDRKSQKLELIATCLWVQRREHITEPTAVKARVKEIKPKYGETDVTEAITDAEVIARALAPGPLGD